MVPESPVRTPGRISWPAAVLLSAWLVALLVAVSQAPDWGWASGWVVGLLVASVLLAVAWMAVELRSRQPLIDMRMMRIPAVWATNLVGLLFGVGMYSLFAFLPEFLQTPSAAGYGFGASITESGLILLPMSVSMFAFGVFSGRLASRFSAKAVLVFGSAVSVLPLLILAFAHAHIWQIAVATFLLGAGFGLAFAAMSSIIVDSVPSSQTGVASGMNANIRTIGGSVGAAVMASVVTSRLLPDGLPTESGYTAGFAMLAGALLLAALAGLLIPSLRECGTPPAGAGRDVASGTGDRGRRHPGRQRPGVTGTAVSSRCRAVADTGFASGVAGVAVLACCRRPSLRSAHDRCPGLSQISAPPWPTCSPSSPRTTSGWPVPMAVRPGG